MFACLSEALSSNSIPAGSSRH